jgi:hypothetical protein
MRPLLSDPFADRDDLPWEAFGAPSMSPDERATQRVLWEERCHEERYALALASERLRGFVETSQSTENLLWAQRMVRDEARHVELTTRVAAGLGMRPVRHPLADTSPPRPRRPAIDRVALDVTAALCVIETVNVALITASRDDTRDTLLRSVSSILINDGAYHSRRALAWLRESWFKLPVTSRLYVELQLPDVFSALEHGPCGVRMDLFYCTIFDLVIPQLERAGVHAEAAWERRPTASEEATPLRASS